MCVCVCVCVLITSSSGCSRTCFPTNPESCTGPGHRSGVATDLGLILLPSRSLPAGKSVSWGILALLNFSVLGPASDFKPPTATLYHSVDLASLHTPHQQLDLTRTSIHDKHSVSVKITTLQEHISHCKTACCTIWLNIWSYLRSHTAGPLPSRHRGQPKGLGLQGSAGVQGYLAREKTPTPPGPP
jgi:hypothetical protein